MGEHNGINGNGTSKAKANGSAPVPPISATPAPAIPAASASSAIEYYILCPQRATEVPGLITHLISRDICDKRQSENYHKCPNCVRSRMWREKNGLPVEEAAAAHS